MSERLLVSSWEMMHKDNDGEAQITELHKYLYPPEPENWQASPARITPSRAKQVRRDTTDIFVFSDTQIGFRRVDEELRPMHDPIAMRAARLLCKDLRPDVIVNCGDTVDYSNISRFGIDSDHFWRTMGPSHQAAHDMYAEYRADNPHARIVEVGSNHIKRLTDHVLRKVPDLYDLHRAGEEGGLSVLTYPYLANLQHVGVEFIDGYGAAEFQYADDLAFIHGTYAVSNGSTASKLSKANPDRNIIQGHKHSIETHYRTDRRGRQLGAFVVGALCKTTGDVPSYHSAIDQYNHPVHYQEDWQQGVMHIKDYGDGEYEFNHIPIRHGVIKYQGKEYSGHETIA